MEHQEILNLLTEAGNSKVAARKWNIVYELGKEIIYNTEVLTSNLCDYNDAYVWVKGNIVTTTHNNPTS